MRRFIVLAVVVCVAFVQRNRADDTGRDADDAVKKELAALQGTWVMIGNEVAGNKATKRGLEIVKAYLVVKGDGFSTWAEQPGNKGEVQKAKLTLDPAAKPKAFDKIIIDGPSKGKTIPGIYELKGDELKICIAWMSDKRPTEFAGKADGAAMVIILKREKK